MTADQDKVAAREERYGRYGAERRSVAVRRVASQAIGQNKAEVYGARWGLDAHALEALAKAGVI